MKQKLFLLAALLLMSLQFFATTYSGTCGDNLTWTLDTETGELVLSGIGDMTTEYDYTFHLPWYDYRDYIRLSNESCG